MEDVLPTVVFLAVWVGLGLLLAKVGKSKGVPGPVALWGSLLLSPLGGLVLIMALKPKGERTRDKWGGRDYGWPGPEEPEPPATVETRRMRRRRKRGCKTTES